MAEEAVGAALNSSGDDYGADEFEDLMEADNSEAKLEPTADASNTGSKPQGSGLTMQEPVPTSSTEPGATVSAVAAPVEASTSQHSSGSMRPSAPMQAPTAGAHGTQPAPVAAAAPPSSSSQGTILQQVASQPSAHAPAGPSHHQQPAGSTSAPAASQGDAAAAASRAGTEHGQAEPGEFDQQGPPRPHYLKHTAVIPKLPGEEFKNAEHETVMLAFSTGTLSGIRSLPNALDPGFRTRLYDAIVAQHEAARETRRADSEGPTEGPRLAYGLATSGLGMPVACGQRAVPRVHPYSGAFTSFEYMPSEYDRGRLVGKFEKLRGKLAQVAPVDFVVKAPPVGPRGTPAFSEFEYSNDPFVNMTKLRQAEDVAARAGSLAGPFVTGGRVAPQTLMRGRADECMMALCRVLSGDWPTAFLQVFEDRSGAIVVSFDRRRALTEGDLPSYMQNMVKAHWLVAEYTLVKDGTQWGLVDDETQSVFYLFWPPWVRHRYVGPLLSNAAPGGAQGADGSQSSPTSEPSSPSAVSSGGQRSEGAALRSESSNQRQAILSTDFARMGALSRSAAQMKAATGTAAGAGPGAPTGPGRIPPRSPRSVAVV